MVINGYDYKFLYSVGAFLSIQAAKLPKTAKTPMEKIRIVWTMAAIMSKEYEDAQRLDDPDYEVNYLTIDRMRTMSMPDFEQLSKEVDDAIKAGNERTVQAQPATKKKGAGKGSK